MINLDIDLEDGLDNDKKYDEPIKRNFGKTLAFGFYKGKPIFSCPHFNVYCITFGMLVGGTLLVCYSLKDVDDYRIFLLTFFIALIQYIA